MSAKMLICLAAALGTAAAAQTGDPRKEGWRFGAAEYSARCAPCHGALAKGDGPVAKQYKEQMSVPDLTTYAKRNGGKFPTELAWQKIDGRPVSFDYERNMPVWGRDFRHEALAAPMPSASPESYVAAEIAAIIEYLKTLQVK
jgi:mono/diheme cytochrome c family protein